MGCDLHRDYTLKNMIIRAVLNATCLTAHMPAVSHQNFWLPKSNARSTTRERGNDYRGWAIYTDGGTRVVDGETLA